MGLCDIRRMPLRSLNIGRLAVCGAVLSAVVGLGACGKGGGSSDVVARVGGYPITGTELDHWLSIRAATSRRAVSDRAVSGEAPRQAVLSFLIASRWTMGEAAELGVRVSDREAQKQLERFKYVQLEGLKYEKFPNEAELQKSLAGAGETHSDQLWLMKLNMLATRIEQARLSEALRQVTHAEIARYYDENRRRFVMPERRDIHVIATQDEATARKAKREVQSGKSFLSVLKRVSIYPEYPEGLPNWQREDVFHKHIFAAKPHVLTGPVHQILYYVFEVTKVTPPRQRALAEVEASIRQRLAAQRQRRVSTELLDAFKRKWVARTSCRPGYVVPRCRQYTGAASATSGSPPYSTADGTAASAIGLSSPSANTGVVVSTKKVKLGTILAAGPKMLTVYMFDGDKRLTSTCYGACAKVWVPVRTTGAVVAGGQAIPDDPGTITRSDGTKQATYYYHPLYYYVKDRDSSDYYGQGVKSFGAHWYALRTIGVKFQKLPKIRHLTGITQG
jgi:foldase protein PrsA